MATAQPTREGEPVVKNISRREFLYYLLGASVGLLGVESCVMSTAYLLPHQHDHSESGYFKVEMPIIPGKGSSPVGIPQGRFWLSHTTLGLLAFKMNCIRCDTLFKWVPLNNRFECPRCGSKFQPNGDYVTGTRVRDLDRYLIEVYTSNGTRKTPSSGAPVSLTDAVSVVINTNKVIQHYPCGAQQYDGYNVSVVPCPDGIS